MGLGCGGAMMKYLLFFFNFIFFVCGATILGIGIWVQIDPKVLDYISLTIANKSDYDVAVYMFLAVGGFILLVGFLGCCGACQESTCMLCLFAGLMIIIVLLQVVASVFAVVFKSQIEKELKDHLKVEMYDRVGADNTEAITKAINRLQMEMKCCGTDSYKDYGKYSLIYNETMPDATNAGKYVPQSCCTKAKEDKGIPDLGEDDWEKCSKEAQEPSPNKEILLIDPCYQSLVDYLDNHTLYVIIAGFGLAAIELFGIVFACCVRSKISEQSY